jgi:hypothetical protein
MVERIAALAGGVDEDAEVGLGRRLAGEIIEQRRTQRTIRRFARLALGIRDVAVARHVAGHVPNRAGIVRDSNNPV